MVITDGDSDFAEMTKKEARLAHEAGITIIALGIGGRVGRAELEAIASQPDNVFLADDFRSLTTLNQKLALKFCEGRPSHEFVYRKQMHSVIYKLYRLLIQVIQGPVSNSKFSELEQQILSQAPLRNQALAFGFLWQFISNLPLARQFDVGIHQINFRFVSLVF